VLTIVGIVHMEEHVFHTETVYIVYITTTTPWPLVRERTIPTERYCVHGRTYISHWNIVAYHNCCYGSAVLFRAMAAFFNFLILYSSDIQIIPARILIELISLQICSPKRVGVLV
jgi:hypothetical protein